MLQMRSTIICSTTRGKAGQGSYLHLRLDFVCNSCSLTLTCSLWRRGIVLPLRRFLARTPTHSDHALELKRVVLNIRLRSQWTYASIVSVFSCDQRKGNRKIQGKSLSMTAARSCEEEKV